MTPTGYSELPSPSPSAPPLNLFNYHLNGSFKVIFFQTKFLKMPIPHFTHKNHAPDQFLHGVIMPNTFSIFMTQTGFLNKFDLSEFS